MAYPEQPQGAVDMARAQSAQSEPALQEPSMTRLLDELHEAVNEYDSAIGRAASLAVGLGGPMVSQEPKPPRDAKAPQPPDMRARLGVELERLRRYNLALNTVCDRFAQVLGG